MSQDGTRMVNPRGCMEDVVHMRHRAEVALAPGGEGG